MPPLPLDERIVVIQRSTNLTLCEGSPQTQLRSHISTSANGHVAHPPHLYPPQRHPYSPNCNSLALECKRRSSRSQKSKGVAAVIPATVIHAPSHCHSNGTVTLGPRPQAHTHTVDIKVSLDKGPKRGGDSLRHNGAKGSRTRQVSIRSDQSERRGGAAERPRGGGNRENSQRSRRQSQPPGPLGGGLLEFVPAQAPQVQARREQERETNVQSRREQEKETKVQSRRERERETVTPNASPSATGLLPRGEREFPPVENKQSAKLGTVHHNPPPHSLSRHHSSVPVPHASVLNTHYPSSPLPHPAAFFQQLHQPPRPARGREHRPHSLHDLPLSPCSSHGGGFPSPDHTCTIDFSRPFNCGCWRLVRCKGCKGHSVVCQAGGNPPPSSFPRGHGIGGVGRGGGGGRAMGLKTLGGCLSVATSSSGSTASDCPAFGPLACSCSGEAGVLQSSALLRKKLVGGCLPCAPLASSAPLRALQSCVMGCNPRASQTGSSTCSYCSSDPIVVTFNPRRGGGGAYPADDDDYSVRTVWPEELSKKMARSKAQKNHCVGAPREGKGQSGSNGTNLVLLDCQNLLEFSRSQLTDHAGRRRLQQGFIGSGRDEGRNSLKRLLNKGGEAVEEDQEGDATYPPPRSPSPQSPLSFSPPPSAPTTLRDAKPRQRDRDGGQRDGGQRERDGGQRDRDGGQRERDGGQRDRDGGQREWDGGQREWDGGQRDGGQRDGGQRDGGQRDGGQRDGGQRERDGGQRAGGQRDGGQRERDGGQRDGGQRERDGGQRDGGQRDGGHSLPSAQSLHLVLNSLNREQDEGNSRMHLSLPLSSSLPACLSGEGSVTTPDAENAVVSAILPFLFLGNERDAQDLELLLTLGVAYVVNVTSHLPLYHLPCGLLRYKRLPATDNSRQNLRQYFEEVCEFIEEAHQSGHGVLVHCQAGVSRSATIVIAYLMKHTLMTMTDAYKYVRSRRPVVSPNLNFMGQLLEFERDLNSGVTPRILMPKLSGLETQV